MLHAVKCAVSCKANVRAQFYDDFCSVLVRLRYGRLPFAAAVETVFGMDPAGGARRGRLRGEVRALPLSYVDTAAAWARVTGADETEGHAERCAAYGRAPDGSDPERTAGDAGHATQR